MRFCPKCSLKIKGTITQCPLCKVELLSCADDDEPNTVPPEKDQPSSSDREGKQVAQPFTTRGTTAPPSAPPIQNHQDISAVTAPPSGAAPRASRPSNLDQSLRNIEQQLSIRAAKEEVITRSLVELAARVSSIEKSLQDIKKSAALSNLAIKKNEKENTRPAAQPPGQVTGQMQHAAWEDFPPPGKTAPPQHDAKASDFPPPSLSAAQDNRDFFSEPAGDFDDRPEKNNLLTGSRSATRPSPRKTAYTLATVVLLLALLTALAFYYNSLQQKTDQQRVITEEISIPSPPEQGKEIPPEQGSGPRQDQKPGTMSTREPPPESVPQVSPQKEIAQEPVLPQPEPQKARDAFSVCVGSFKDKANALALTSKLTNKGYPVHIDQLKNKALFRVQVGSFSDRKQALEMAHILAKKEQLPTAVITSAKP